MKTTPKSLKPIFWLAILLSVLTWGLIMLGGVVHGTGSSLACPDWPTCHGTFFPEMRGAVLIEHTHRLVAASVGFLTIMLVILCHWRGPRFLKIWSWVALGLVIFQGLLGGVTVLYRLPNLVSTAHLGTSMAFFGVLIWISALSAKNRFRSPPVSGISGGTRAWILSSLVLVFLQMILGAYMRHLGGGLACVDLPLCQGSLWPAGAPFALKVHMLHRILGVVVALVLMISAWQVARQRLPIKGLPWLLVAIPSLVILQIGLGLWSVASALELFPVTAHLGCAALIWVGVVYLWFLAGRPAVREKRSAQDSALAAESRLSQA